MMNEDFKGGGGCIILHFFIEPDSQPYCCRIQWVAVVRVAVHMGSTI